MPFMASLTQLDLSNNQLCGVWYDDYYDLQGTYDATGITALAGALGAMQRLAD